MKRMILILLMISSWATCFSQESRGSLHLEFKNCFDGRAIRLNDSNSIYYNANGDDLKMRVLKYYISNISLLRSDGHAEVLDNNYLLVDASDSLSLRRQITNVPVGEYVGITFTVGVDSARNFSGAQSDDLDPSKGMFWTWNNGYIFLKLEGSSLKSSAKGQKLTLHIGGVEHPNTITLQSAIFDHPMVVSKTRSGMLEFRSNISTLFSGKTIIDFSKVNTVMGGMKAELIADNYAGHLFQVSVKE